MNDQVPATAPGRSQRRRVVLLAGLAAGLLAGVLLIGGWLWLTWTGGWTPPAGMPDRQRVLISPMISLWPVQVFRSRT